MGFDSHGMDCSIRHIVDIIDQETSLEVGREGVERKDRIPGGRFGGVRREHPKDNRPPTLKRGILIKTKTDPRKRKRKDRQVTFPNKRNEKEITIATQRPHPSSSKDTKH
jgi:hypothetical protein